MSRWMCALALLAAAFVVVSCATPEPVVAPTVVPAPTVEALVAPTVEPEVGGTGMTASELEAAAVALTPEELALWEVEYTLPDGTIVVPAAPPMEGSPSLAVLARRIAEGDLDADSDVDKAVLLVDSSNPEEPQLYLAALINEDGTLVNAGTVALPAGLGASALSYDDGKLLLVATAADALVAWQLFVYEWIDGQLVQVGDAEQLPSPTAVPTDSPQLPAPPTVGITLDPQSKYAVPGEKVDIYVNATNSPGIVKLEWYLDNVKQDETVFADAEGVPYTHQTFVWRISTVGEHYIFVTATDKFGQVGTSVVEMYTVEEVQ